MRKLLPVLLVGLSVPGAFAQDTPTFRSGVDVVTVDVGVVDPRGKPVDDLHAADFKVKIDGQARRVVSATLVKIDPEAVKKSLAVREETFFTTNLTPPEGRQIVIAVDQTNIRPGSLKVLMQTASAFVDRLSPLDQVAFRAYPDPGVKLPFTSDRLRLKLAMDTLLGHQEPMDALTRRNIGVAEAIAIDQAHDDQTLNDVATRECPSARTPEALDECKRDISMQASALAQRSREVSDAGFRGLLDLLRELAKVDGAKTLILLSEGIAVNDAADLDLIAAVAGRARVALDVLIVDSQDRDIDLQRLSPTIDADRRRQTSGLQNIASASRGAVFHAIGTAEGVFERLLLEMSAYYVLGVEQLPGDEVEKNHRVDVEVGRRGVTIRSPQAFAVSSAGRPKASQQDNLQSALFSPFAVAEIPLRVTTFAQQEPTGPKVRISIAADVGQPGAAAAPYSVGYALVDRDNRVAASFSRTLTLSSQSHLPTEPLTFVATAAVDPGAYTLHFAVVDPDGRRGSVIRDVAAWKMLDEELAWSDLVVDTVPAAGQGLRMAVEPHLSADMIAAVVEIYSNAPATLEQLKTTFEIADDVDAPPLAKLDGSMRAGTVASGRVAQALIPTAAIPAGRYVARVRVTRDGKTLSLLSRPLVLEKTAGASGAAPAPSPSLSFASRIARFDRDAVLTPEVVKPMLDLVGARSPALKDAMTEARAGRYGAAALEALSTGDQEAAAFLRGFDLFSKGQLDQAATQLQVAAGPRRQFFPAAFYLGAVFAAAGRDRDAAGTWQLALGTDARPVMAYTVAADARLRDGAPDAAVTILKPAYDRAPADDEIGRRLAMAYLMTNRYAEALPVLDGYLSRHATDPDLLLGAVVAQYEVVKGGQTLSNTERDRVKRWAAAYRGDQSALVDKYVQVMGAR